MRRNLYTGMLAVLFSIVLVLGCALEAKALYDDFSGLYIDDAKRSYQEFVKGVVRGKLASKIDNDLDSNLRNR